MAKKDEPILYITRIENNKRYLGFVDEDGIVVINQKGNPKVAGGYWVVTHKTRDMFTGEVTATIEYWTLGGIETFTVPAALLLDPRTIKQLLHKYGIDCLACEAWQLATYAQIYFNTASEYVTYNRLGWYEYKGEKVFLSWKVYQAANPPRVIQAQERLFQNYKPTGKLEPLLEMLEADVRHNPAAVCVVAVAAASPIWGLIYEDFPDPSFVLNLCGLSSTGKTILQQLCASFAGNPTLTKGTTLKDFNATEAGFYRQFNGILGLPLIVNDLSLDDNKRTDEDDKRVKVMRICSGASKTKCARDNLYGLEPREYFAAPFLTSSERTFFSDDMPEGVAGRLLELRLQNFCTNEESGNRTRHTALKNYGIFLDMLVQYLLDNYIAPGKLDELRELNQQHINTLADMLTGCPKHLLRLGQSVAVLLTGAEIFLKDCLGLDWSLNGLRDLLVQQIRLNSNYEAKQFTALQLRTIAQSKTSTATQPFSQSKSLLYMDGAEVGYLENRCGSTYASLGPKERIVLTKEAFDKIYGNGDGDTFALRSDLKKHGLLDCDDSKDNKRHTRRLTIAGKETPCYVIRLAENFKLPEGLTTGEAIDNPGATPVPHKSVQSRFELKPLSAEEAALLEEIGL